MGPTSHGRPRERLRNFLEERYRGRPGALAHDVAISPKVAENLLAGHWPGDMTFAAILRCFGRDLVAAVFDPEIEPVLARLNEEERRLERALEEARQRRRQVGGNSLHVPGGLEAHHGEDPRSAAAEPVKARRSTDRNVTSEDR